jgi:hypothetical protein
VTTRGRGECSAGPLGRDTHSRPAWTCRRAACQLCAALHGVTGWVGCKQASKQASNASKQCNDASIPPGTTELLDVTHTHPEAEQAATPATSSPPHNLLPLAAGRRFCQNAEAGAPRKGCVGCPDPITVYFSLTCVSSPPPPPPPLLILNLHITTPTLCLHFSSIHPS